MDINESRVGYVCIPRRALAKRMAILWCFELAACTMGAGVFFIDTVLIVTAMAFFSLKFLPVWRMYYKPVSLYIVLLILLVPTVFLGRFLRELILWLIPLSLR